MKSISSSFFTIFIVLGTALLGIATLFFVATGTYVLFGQSYGVVVHINDNIGERITFAICSAIFGYLCYLSTIGMAKELQNK